MHSFFNALLADFVTDPKGTAKKFAGFFDNMMQMALSGARGIGAEGAHAMFDFLDKDYYEMGKGIGKVIGTIIANVLLAIFSQAIGNLIAKGASFVGKAAEFVAGKAVEVFNWMKGIFSKAVGVLRDAVNGALKMFPGVVNKAVEAFDALVALFSEALAGEKVAAGVGKTPGQLSNVMESRMVSGTRTAPATVADLTPPKVHPSKMTPGPDPTPAELADPSRAGTTAKNEVVGEAHNAANFAKYKSGLKTTEAANPLVGSLQKTGKLPPNYLTKQQAVQAGWKPGKALENSVPGGQLGGDIFHNTTGVVPSAPGRVWYEADIGLTGTMSRANQPGTRLLYSNDGLLYVTPDHYNTVLPIGAWKK